MADKHGAHQTNDAWVISKTEDFCKSPSALAGYMISQTLAVSAPVATSVNGLGTPVLNMDSRITSVNGNKGGTGGGVVSGVNCGMCRPVANYAPTVRAEGKPVLRHDTVMCMNTAGPNGPSNTTGAINYLEKMKENPEVTKIALNWKKGDKEIVLPSGRKIPIRPAQPGEGSHYSPMPLEIVLESDANAGTVANETQHAMDDDKYGIGDGVPHDENGRKLHPLEAEARSDEASAPVVFIKYKETGIQYPETKYILNQHNTYVRRAKVLRRALEAQEKGDIKEAHRILREGGPECSGYENKLDPLPTPTPTSTPTGPPTGTPTPTSSPTGIPTGTPTQIPSPTPTVTPTGTPTPTSSPTGTPAPTGTPR